MRLPFDQFDLLAPYYDQIIARPADESLLTLAGAGAGQVVLDVGGGTGRIAIGLAASGARVVVCDRSLKMLSQARDKGLPVVRAEVAHLPFSTDAMDRLLVIDAFHHFVVPSAEIGQARAAAELVRVLRPGGRLLVEEPDIRRWQGRAIRWVERILLMGSRFLSPDQLLGCFAATGARVVLQNDNRASTRMIISKDQASAPLLDLTVSQGGRTQDSREACPIRLAR